MSTETDAPGFHDAAPMELDRTPGWRHFSERGDVYQVDDIWYLTTTETVQFAHRNPEIFSSARAFDSLGSPVPLIPIATDPPDHVRYRRVLDPMLAPRVVNAMEDDLRAQIQELIDAFVDRGECDVMEDIARLYPTQVILTLFGLPLEDRDQFIEWTESIIGASAAGVAQATPEQLEGAMALFGYLQSHLDQKRANPGDDMLSRVLELSGEDAWTDEELLGMCFLFVIAGLDTVTATIGFVMYHLARRPDLRERILADPTLTTPFIEEVLRLELPAPTTPRVTTREVTVNGVTIPAGAYVLLVLGTVNRDATRGEHPDEIDLAQEGRGHLSFGGGIHRCLGSHLARRELRLVVEEFHKRIPDYHIPEGAEPRIKWPSATLHFTSLPLVFEGSNPR
jgi:cytochrome P450